MNRAASHRNRGTNIEPSGFANGPDPAGFNYFRVDPASAGIATDWVDETDAASDDAANGVVLYYSDFSSSEYFLGLTGSFTDTVTATVDILNIEVMTTRDSDQDGVPDHLDLDSDNDGISDLYEGGHTLASLDSDLNGLHDSGIINDDGPFLGVPSTSLYATGALAIDEPTINTDGDALADFIDLDSDNDGIPDTVEARPTANYEVNDGDVSNNDLDEDGVILLFDANDGPFGELGGTFPPWSQQTESQQTSSPWTAMGMGQTTLLRAG